MTLIAQMSVNGAPFLVGDVLLSSETRMGLKVNLPLVGDINQILANNGFPFEVGFAQKINVFDGRIAVAWSGPSIQAKRALQVIADISPRENLTVDNILAELKAINQTKIDQLQLIGLLLEEVIGTTVKVSVFALRVPRTEISPFGNAYVAGSGERTFVKLVQNWNWQAPATEYQFAHGLLGALTNEEYRTGNTIINKWGGAFEALTFSSMSGRFEKVGDVLHTFWEMTENNDDSLGLFPEAYPFSSGATRYGVRRNSRRAAPRIQDVDLTGSKGISLCSHSFTRQHIGGTRSCYERRVWRKPGIVN